MKRRTLSLIISGLLGVIAILSGIYLMAASVTNYIAESKKTDWIVTEARITDVSSRVKMLMCDKVTPQYDRQPPLLFRTKGHSIRRVHDFMLYLKY